MRFYGMGYHDLLVTPLSAFWELSKNIRRLQATDNIRHFNMLCSVIGGGEKYIEGLRNEQGEIIRTGEEDESGFDRDAMDQFRARFFSHNP